MSDLGHSLKLKFGLAPAEPTDAQLVAIVSEIELIRKARIPADVDWENAVRKYCPTYGTYKYAGVDNSSLNALLAQMSTQGQRK